MKNIRVKIKFVLLPIFLLTLVCVDFVYSTNRYIDYGTHGAVWDGINGSSYTCSGGKGFGYLSIQAAIDEMNPGDTLFLRGGTYNETHINITPYRNGFPGSPNTIKSYPGEWAIIDGKYQDPTFFRPAVIWGTGGAGISYWTFENLEITGGGDTLNPPGGGEGILLEDSKNCTFRYLYIHHNSGDQANPGATGGIRLLHPKNCIIEYCYFKANGNLTGQRNTGNGQLAMVADYAYEHPVDTNRTMAKNIIRYNLFDGDGGQADKFTPIAIMHKGMQRFTGYVYGETENPLDSLPNSTSLRDFGDNIHHNIILNSPYGIRIDQDYTQFHQNIIDLSVRSGFSESIGVLLRDEFSSRRGPVYACVYNNLIKSNGLRGINFRIIPDGYDGSILGTSVDYFSGFAVNNIFENSSVGYDWAPLSFEGSNTANCLDGEPLKLSNFNVSRNFFYSCTQGDQVIRFSNKDFNESEIEETASADDVYKKDTPLPYQGTTNPLKYKTISNYELDNSRTIADGGTGGVHPYLQGVALPLFIGAANPEDNDWVEGVLGLSSVTNLQNGTSGEASWVEGKGTTSLKNLTDKNKKYELLQNYPNPFNPSTVIKYQIPVNSNVSLKIYDLMGREVITLVNEHQPAGIYKVKFDGSNLASGVYIYTLKAGGKFKQSRKLLLIK